MTKFNPAPDEVKLLLPLLRSLLNHRTAGLTPCRKSINLHWRLFYLAEKGAEEQGHQNEHGLTVEEFTKCLQILLEAGASMATFIKNEYDEDEPAICVAIRLLRTLGPLVLFDVIVDVVPPDDFVEWDLMRSFICQLLLSSSSNDVSDPALIIRLFQINLVKHNWSRFTFFDRHVSWEMMQAALDIETEPNSPVIQKYGRHWLLRACENGKSDIIQHLLRLGAAPDLDSKNRQIPFLVRLFLKLMHDFY
jgi:hypothetical protein